MRKYNRDYETCLQQVKKARPCVQPNMGFVKQLKDL